MNVAYQGAAGAFSELAALRFFKDQKPETIGFSDFPSMFQAVESGAVDYGMFPVENTTTGLITRTYDLFQFHQVFAIGEIKVPIRQNLISLPGVTLNEIREVYSHPEALSQCSRFFAAHPAIRQVVYEDTALSVKYIRDLNDPSKAAIASSRAAEVYGLPILIPAAQDDGGNTTRFLCLTREKRFDPQADKISIRLVLQHDPGALYHTLGVFASKRINVLLVESRPIPGKQFEYCFYLDFEGNLNDPDVAEVLRRLEYDSLSLQLIGNYRADQ